MSLTVVIPRIGAATRWRDAARALAMRDVSPDAVEWRDEASAASLFESGNGLPEALGEPAHATGAPPKVPKEFVTLAEAVVCHRAPDRFDRLYRVLRRFRDEPMLLRDASDPAVAALRGMEKAIRRDSHKMTAFVRFRDVGGEDGGRRRFAAWFEPEHHIVERVAPFFARRFADMDWLIATPSLWARYVEGELSLAEAGERPALPDDAADDLWRTYFASIFNPARLKVKAMMAEMPKRYWRNLPEARLIPALVEQAGRRSTAMIAAAPTPTSPHARAIARHQGLEGAVMADLNGASERTLDQVREEARGCQRCPLYRDATQTVFGEGSADASLVFVGEQPGDMEDLSGRPFVGPAGRLFDEALAEAGIDRAVCYVTNSVKHFKFVQRGRRRIHQKPDTAEIRACNAWLVDELAIIKPRLVVALGNTAAQALTGVGDGILKRRGRVETALSGQPVFLTVHPSMILRIPDQRAAGEARAQFTDDLRSAAAEWRRLAA